MDSVKAEGKRYKIEMNICKPKKMTERGSWFSHDTSTIDFTSLKSNDIECGGYFDKGMPTLISGPEEKLPFNQFQFSGQVFVWEEIYIFKISDQSSKGWMPEMYIMIPMKYKSFWTHIDITNIEFQSGKVIFLKDLKGVYGETDGTKILSFNRSLKNEKGVDVKTFPLRELLEGK
ncbi:MAG TPA: hypothetical protein VKB95_06765 [Chitinophagaceae bacterium]|nr:hypothetical protein [Chitinophagaceae bacterium]